MGSDDDDDDELMMSEQESRQWASIQGESCFSGFVLLLLGYYSLPREQLYS